MIFSLLHRLAALSFPWLVVVFLGIGSGGVGLPQSAWAAAGDLDLTFDGDGRRVFLDSTSDDRGVAAAIQADGKIVVVGESNLFGTADVQLLRFNSNGSSDASFSGNGRRVYDEPAAEDHGLAVAIQSNGKIVVAGYTNLFGSNDILLLRFQSDGSLDSTFDGDGRRIVTGPGDDRAQAVVIQPDGKIVVAGYTNVQGSNDFFLLRFNTNGSLDSSFDGDGRVILSGLGNDRAQAVVLQPLDGKIIVAGSTEVSGNNDFLIVRLNANGNLDGTFGSGGRQVVSGFGGNDQAQAVTLQADGKIVVVGYTNATGLNDFAAARLHVNGSLDISFDLDGRLVISGFAGDDRAQAVAVQSDRKIVVVGYSNGAGNNDFAVARLNENGSLDATFDGDGRLVTRSFGGDDRALAVKLQSDGKIVAAGYSNGAGTNDVAVARYVGR